MASKCVHRHCSTLLILDGIKRTHKLPDKSIPEVIQHMAIVQPSHRMRLAGPVGSGSAEGRGCDKHAHTTNTHTHTNTLPSRPVAYLGCATRSGKVGTACAGGTRENNTKQNRHLNTLIHNNTPPSHTHTHTHGHTLLQATEMAKEHY